MLFRFTPYIIPSSLATVMSIIVASIAWRTWRSRRQQTAAALAALAVCMTAWAALNVAELSSFELTVKIAWMRLEWVAVVTLPVLWFVFALYYSGRGYWLTGRRLAALMAVPTFIVTAVFVNPLKGPGPVWSIAGVVDRGTYSYIDYTPGPLWWGTMAYSYTLVIIGSALMLLMLLRSLSLYRRQIAATLVGVIFPLAASVLFVSQASPIPHLDLTPFAFSLSGVCFAVAALRFHMLDLVPLARDLLIDSMDDGMLVLDLHERIVDLNPAMSNILGLPLERVIGRPAKETLQHWRHKVERFRYQSSAHAEIDLEVAGEVRYYDLRISPLADKRGDLNGRLIVLRDITARVQAEKALKEEQFKSEQLLLNILPEPIARRLKNGEEQISDAFGEATVLFADIVGFTSFSERLAPQTVLALLNDLFSRYDALAEKHGLEKIKTIGDAYMAVSGVPAARENHAQAAAEMALDMVAELARFNQEKGQTFAIRIGLSSGPVVAGVIGRKKFVYDLWGDTVNTANRMEYLGVTGCIQITETTCRLLGNEYACELRGEIEVKGKGRMRTWFLKCRKAGMMPRGCRPAASESVGLGDGI